MTTLRMARIKAAVPASFTRIQCSVSRVENRRVLEQATSTEESSKNGPSLSTDVSDE